MVGKRLRVWALLFLGAALTAASAGVAANASTDGHDQGIRIFSLRNPALGFAPNSSGFVVLAPLGADNAGRWNVTEVGQQGFEDAVYTNVATGTCLAARSPIDGVALTMAPCNLNDPFQQWERSADQLANVSTGRCVRPEAVAAGARLYQEVCGVGGRTADFSDDFRVKLSAASGDGQQIPAGRAGAPLVVKVTDENGVPQAGFVAEIELHGPWGGEDYLPSPATFGTGTTTRVLVTTNAQGLATTPAVTGKANNHSAYTATVGGHFTLFGDTFILQGASFSGTIV